jgi:hypothetical protein
MDAFDRAAATDPDYAHAHLWLAQLQIWRLDPATKWGPHVSSALRNRVSLDERETTLLDALQAIQNGQLSGACAVYEQMRRRDSLDATAWLGLAYCNGHNHLVVRSSRSPTGWAFVGSMAAAQRAYMRALQIAPAAFAAFPFRSITRQYFADVGNTYHPGASADSTQFFALPDLLNDTIAYLPRPLHDLVVTQLEVLAPSMDRAVQRNRESLLGILSSLTLRLPDNADVFEALSHVLEARDEITGTPNGGHSALSALERAKALATEQEQRARVGASDVRLHLKLGDFSRAAAIGDSVLASTPAATGRTALELVGIAALLGREHAAIAYQRASGESVSEGGTLAVPLIEDASTALFMRAAFGVCDDSLRTLRARVTSLLESYVSPSQRETARAGILARPTQFSVECLGAATSLDLSGDLSMLLQAIQTLGRNDLRRAGTQLDSLQRRRRSSRPGEISLDYALTEAWLHATLGDSATAIHQLDLTLTALPTLRTEIVLEPGMAAAVGRSMAFRATLAARMGDGGAAAMWASRVLTLWAHADPSLAPTLARMKILAAHRA